MGRVMRRREAMRAVVRACGFTAPPLRIAAVRGLYREFSVTRETAEEAPSAASARRPARAIPTCGAYARACVRCGAPAEPASCSAEHRPFATGLPRLQSAGFRAERARMHRPSRRRSLFAPPRGARFLEKRAFMAAGPRAGARQFRSSFAARKRQPVSSSVSGRLSPASSDASRVTPPMLSRRSVKTGCPTAASRRFTSW